MPARRGSVGVWGPDVQNSDVPAVPSGHISLYEMNVDRDRGLHTWDYGLSAADNEFFGYKKSIIHPFATKAGGLATFKTMSTGDFGALAYGDALTASFKYPLSASIQREYYSENQDRFSDHQEKILTLNKVPVKYSHIDALRNVLDEYTYLSHHYAYDYGDLGIDKSKQELNLIDIPSIFYGSSIRKGSIDLKFYVSGTLVGQCIDKYKNGELIEVTGSRTGSVAGVVLYKEGFVLLTGSWDITERTSFNTTDPTVPTLPGTDTPIYPRSPHTEKYKTKIPFATTDPAADSPRWVYFGTGIERSNPIGDAIYFASTGYGKFATGSLDTFHLPSSSFSLAFEGTSNIPVITMLAHAPVGELNYSNNPTFRRSNVSAGPAPGYGFAMLEAKGTLAPFGSGKTLTFNDAKGNTYSATTDSSISKDDSTAIKIGIKEIVDNGWTAPGGLSGGSAETKIALASGIFKSISQAQQYGITSDVKDTSDGSALLRTRLGGGTNENWGRFLHVQQLDSGHAGDITPAGTLRSADNIDFPAFTGGTLDYLSKVSGSTWSTATSNKSYTQDKKFGIKNIISSSYANHTASFKKQTYISKIGIYDENKNLIAIAKLANPVKKTEDRDYTFKLKFDI